MREIASGAAIAIFRPCQWRRATATWSTPTGRTAICTGLTGFEEPEAVVVLSTQGDKPFTLFVRPRDKEKEI